MSITIIEGPAPLIEDSDVAGSTDAMILAAQRTFDGPNGWLNRAIGQQTIEISADCWSRQISLPCPPHLTITSVKYDDVDGVEQPVPDTDYKLRGGKLVFASGYSFPALYSYPGSIRVRYTAGYAEPPAEARQALIFMVRDMVQMSSVGAGTLRSETVEDVGSFSYLDPDKVSEAVKAVTRSLLGGLWVPAV